MHAWHLEKAVFYNEREMAVDLAVTNLARHHLTFDSIAVRGVSGMVVGSLLSARLKVDLSIVRKLDEKKASSYFQETPDEVRRYLILDDLVESGGTLYAIVQGMKHAHPEAECVGAYLFVGEDFLSAAKVYQRLADFESAYPKAAKRYCRKPRKISLTS